MTYGDAFLEKLLTFYARPEVSLEFISHQDTGDHTIVVQTGEEVEFKLLPYHCGRIKVGFFTVFRAGERTGN